MRSLVILVMLAGSARADSEPSEFYGYQTMLGGAAVAGLGIWTSYADMSRDNHAGVATLLVIAGAGIGPTVNWANDGYRLAKLRLSTQLCSGAMAAGFLVGVGLELQASDHDSMHSFDWSRVGAFTFAGAGIGAFVDGLVLGHTSSGPTDKFQLNITALPTHGGTAVVLGGRF